MLLMDPGARAPGRSATVLGTRETILTLRPTPYEVRNLAFGQLRTYDHRSSELRRATRQGRNGRQREP